MSVDQKRIHVDLLQPGMYVAKLDRPWIETPFSLQGFYVRDLTDIDLLRRYCREVVIDVSRSRVVADPVQHATGTVRASGSAVSKTETSVQANAAKKRIPTYRTTVAMPQEAAASRVLHEELSASLAEVYAEIRTGSIRDIKATEKYASQMVDSVLRNPDAMVWLSRVKSIDSYSYHHALRCSVWAIVFGRHLGLSKKVLDKLALGAMLMDIGKAKLPAGLLAKRTVLTAEERAELRRHVQYSYEILSNMPGIDPQVLQIVAEHHERYDGSGYPRALSGRDISPLGKIAGLVDTYDAMTSERPYARALTSVEAVSKLYELRGAEFQAQLVEEFIQAIGVYPTGTLVHLSSREVAVVVAQNPDRRLRPKLMLVLDANQRALAQPSYLDMMTVTHDARGEPLRILTSLKPGSFGVDPMLVQLAS